MIAAEGKPELRLPRPGMTLPQWTRMLSLNLTNRKPEKMQNRRLAVIPEHESQLWL